MKIKTIISQHRRDFKAEYECEHCGHTMKAGGYDDTHFHNCIIPKMICKQCGKKGHESYRPLVTKYAEGEVV